ncbi:MAG: NCS1 family nucleobase:cation symporter-1 [Chloroflexota bacterium]
MTARAFDGEIVLPDGRHELTPEADAALGESRLHNEDLAPVPITRRTWTTYNYLALWVGMSINIPSWLLASGLVALGMAWYQAIITIGLANVIVLIPMLLISHAGTKYGIPYPVFARASFGVFGANLPALIRAGVACGWFGIQTWIGGTAIFAVVAALLGEGSWWTTASELQIGFGAAQPWTVWLSFAIFWALNIFVILRGMDAVRRFENWAAPFLIVVFVGLLLFMVGQAGGLGPIIDEPGTLGWGPGFWAIFPLSLMGMIAFWSTLSLNMPDFTRFGRSQREQAYGQALGLPTTMTLFPLIGVLTTSATVVVYGEAIWDPVVLASRLDNPLLLFVAMLTLAIATLSTNIAANVVSPSYDFSNVWPSRISFRTGGLITGVIGILIQPWNLLSDPGSYIFTWLGTYGGATGAIAGVLIADYWLIRRTSLHLADLYKAKGIYAYARGWNWKAVVALLVGIVFAIGGAYSSGGQPFPEGGLVPLLKPLYDYSWVVGLIVGFLVYAGLTRFLPEKETTSSMLEQPV